MYSKTILLIFFALIALNVRLGDLAPTSKRSFSFFDSWTRSDLNKIKSNWKVENEENVKWTPLEKGHALDWHKDDELKLTSTSFLSHLNQKLKIEYVNNYEEGDISVKVSLKDSKKKITYASFTQRLKHNDNEIDYLYFNLPSSINKPLVLDVKFKLEPNNPNETPARSKRNTESDPESVPESVPQVDNLDNYPRLLQLIDLEMADACLQEDKCMNGGVCQNVEAFKSKCNCPEAFTGRYCEKSIVSVTKTTTTAPVTKGPDTTTTASKTTTTVSPPTTTTASTTTVKPKPKPKPKENTSYFWYYIAGAVVLILIIGIVFRKAVCDSCCELAGYVGAKVGSNKRFR